MNQAVITDFGSARKVEPRAGRNAESNPRGSALQTEPTVSPAQISELLQVEVEEFGTNMTLTGQGFTVRWAAPELLSDCLFGLASDMWAFAWICWEVSGMGIHSVSWNSRYRVYDRL